MGEVLIDGAGVILLHQLQAFRSSFEGADGLVELLVRHPHLAAGQPGSGEIEQIVVTKDLQGRITDIGNAILHTMFGAHIRQLLEVSASVLHRHAVHFGIFVAVNQRAVGFY